MMRLSFRIVALVAVLTISASAFAELPGPFYNDPPGDTGGGGCNYCSQTHCGCAAAPAGYRLDSWSCSCSSVDCSQSCNYVAQ